MVCCSDALSEEAIDREVERVLGPYAELSSRYPAAESFLYFTDPHLLSDDVFGSDDVKTALSSYFASAKKIYEQLPLSFCICGGDWLNAGDTQAVAKEKLLYADGLMIS